MNEYYKAYYPTEIGILEIAGTEEGIASISFVKEEDMEASIKVPPIIQECVQQLTEYFRGERIEFTVKLLSQQGTEFQTKVWNKLQEIPYGVTWSYRDLAEAIGNIKAVRAVGNANSKNQLSIIVPCHRVIGSNGKLTGYAGGLWRKEWLLKHEGCLTD